MGYSGAAIVSLQNRLNLNPRSVFCRYLGAIVSLQNRLNLNGELSYSHMY